MDSIFRIRKYSCLVCITEIVKKKIIFEQKRDSKDENEEKNIKEHTYFRFFHHMVDSQHNTYIYVWHREHYRAFMYYILHIRTFGQTLRVISAKEENENKKNKTNIVAFSIWPTLREHIFVWQWRANRSAPATKKNITNTCNATCLQYYPRLFYYTLASKIISYGHTKNPVEILTIVLWCRLLFNMFSYSVSIGVEYNYNNTCM